MTWFSMKGVAPEVEYLYQQARQKVDDGEYQHAVDVLNQAVQISPRIPQVFIELGNCFDNLNRYDDAIISYEKALQIDPFHPDALFNKGMCLKKIGNEVESLKCIERAIELYCGT
ncbi:MAG: tetratricopeptide repeat protein [Methanospirillum sp.]|uniref:tetratricopeptide repeat protein n=1 Tax=Methanospirillum sp. TaxID=45200 RepID=UPI0023761D6B|nr:tetratricopeptide repeat protein [Methanospirillum sp.]MDD1729595.1 tetratricopeptide repeat protein [Methanospirillum sp.]